MSDPKPVYYLEQEPRTAWVYRHPHRSIVLVNIVTWSFTMLADWWIAGPNISFGSIAMCLATVVSTNIMPKWPSSPRKLSAMMLTGMSSTAVLTFAYLSAAEHPEGTFTSYKDILEMALVYGAGYAILVSTLYFAGPICYALERRFKDRSNRD
ncbi:hypothetical protein ABFT80_22575 [Mesorhizobium sp. SB112]|uniref:hypothetical protein n=1 Tax=Mesorhizobium sp. SB112 TaxID=3151853 RepID=UPI0032656497